ncbi:glycosyl transferase family 1 [Paenibacillus nanensis]|uniref:Glycosyl transferase family 1 n=1 Tax=Paenibacillus nanensis TaxID=393251 RepID=A0A3A1UV03_9BACL|nr:glycosyltransferase [Paenibacillus nanensis]RIX52337.1 glycosyl transferase family 1 [Paenibacillus nanensis]
MNPPNQPRLKVCMLVLQHPFLDARIFKREALSLVKLGYDVTMVVPRNKDGLMYDIDGTPFKDRFRSSVFVHKSVKIVSYKAVMPQQAHMEKAIQSEGYSFFNDPLFKVGLAQNADIYHAHEYHSLYSGVGIKRALQQTRGKNVKLIYDSHEITEGNKVPLLKRMLGEVDSVVTVSDAMEKWYTDNMPSLHTVTLYNSPPLSASYTPRPVSKDEFVACYEGYMHKDKGSSAKLFEITSLCSRQFPFRFKVLGGVAGKSLNIPEPIKSNIQLCGWVDYYRIPEYMEDVDVGWIDYDIKASSTPINYQVALPNKLFSYLNNGVPVVVNECPEMARFVREHDCGIVIEHPNPTASQYAESFRYLSENREELLRLSHNARKIMSEQYSWEHMETRLAGLYQSLADSLRNMHDDIS